MPRCPDALSNFMPGAHLHAKQWKILRAGTTCTFPRETLYLRSDHLATVFDRILWISSIERSNWIQDLHAEIDCYAGNFAVLLEEEAYVYTAVARLASTKFTVNEL